MLSGQWLLAASVGVSAETCLLGAAVVVPGDEDEPTELKFEKPATVTVTDSVLLSSEPLSSMSSRQNLLRRLVFLSATAPHLSRQGLENIETYIPNHVDAV